MLKSHIVPYFKFGVLLSMHACHDCFKLGVPIFFSDLDIGAFIF